MIVGLINPGDMGASIGFAATQNASKVIWVDAGRSEATRARAKKAGLTAVASLADLAGQSDIIISVCPPHSAGQVADDVLASGFTGLFVEANAISPDQSRAIAGRLKDAGISFVDGGIVGGPAWQREAGTCLWLSGDDAASVAALFSGSSLHTAIAGTDIGAASALKMCYAAYTKGSIALLTAILGVAEKEGISDALANQWGESFTTQTHARTITSSAKAWRWVGEMEEIAATFEGAGLPGGFHEAAADVFSRLQAYKDFSEAPTREAFLASVLKRTD